MRLFRQIPALIALCSFGPLPIFASQVFVEAEAFTSRGGWTLDTRFIEIMGSPYLLAHGMGKPVQDAATKINFPATGTWQIHRSDQRLGGALVPAPVLLGDFK